MHLLRTRQRLMRECIILCRWFTMIWPRRTIALNYKSIEINLLQRLAMLTKTNNTSFTKLKISIRIDINTMRLLYPIKNRECLSIILSPLGLTMSQPQRILLLSMIKIWRDGFQGIIWPCYRERKFYSIKNRWVMSWSRDLFAFKVPNL